MVQFFYCSVDVGVQIIVSGLWNAQHAAHMIMSDLLKDAPDSVNSTPHVVSSHAECYCTLIGNFWWQWLSWYAWVALVRGCSRHPVFDHWMAGMVWEWGMRPDTASPVQWDDCIIALLSELSLFLWVHAVGMFLFLVDLVYLVWEWNYWH